MLAESVYTAVMPPQRTDPPVSHDAYYAAVTPLPQTDHRVGRDFSVLATSNPARVHLASGSFHEELRVQFTGGRHLRRDGTLLFDAAAHIDQYRECFVILEHVELSAKQDFKACRF